MIISSLASRIGLAVTAALAAATATGAIAPRYAVWCVAVMAFLQAFQHPVTQSTRDNQTATDAITRSAVLK